MELYLGVSPGLLCVNQSFLVKFEKPGASKNSAVLVKSSCFWQSDVKKSVRCQAI